MKQILTISLLVWTVAVAIPEKSIAQATSTQVLYGEDLTARGVYRLGDIGLFIHRSRNSSVDGFSSNMSLGGLTPLQHSGYKLQVDGHNLESGFWDVQNLTSLGIPMTDVDSIRIVETPVMDGGLVAVGGLIQVFTRSYDERVTTSISTFAGNESGDPGPFRYSQDDLIIANVDKIGPDAAGSFVINDNGVVFSAGVAVSQLIPSDEAVFTRNRKIFDIPTTPEVRMISPHVRFSWAGDSFTSDARVFALSDRDMVFSRSIAREIPVDVKQIQASWLGSTKIGSEHILNINTSLRTIDVSNLASANRIPLRWNETNIRMDIGVESSNPGARLVGYGYTLSLSRASTFTSNPISNQQEMTVYASSGHTLASIGITTNVFVGVYNGRFTGGVLASGTRELTGTTISAHSSILRVSRMKSDPVGTWLGAGLSSSPDIPTTAQFGRTYGLYTADVAWSWRPPATGISVTVSPSLRYFQDIDLHARTIQADGDGFVVTSNKSQRSDGTIAGLNMSLIHSATTVRNSLSFDRQQAIQGDVYFRRSLDELPGTKIVAESIVMPAPSFRAIVSAMYLSSAQWFDYRFLDSDPEGLYNSTVDPAFRFDAGISKTFWSGRVTTQVMIENIFNDHISYHPIGARFDRTMKLTAHVKLD